MNNEVLNAIKTRRSIRKYKAEQITDEQLDAILEAGTYAATGMGKQSPVIVVVQKPELIAKLSKMNAAVMGTTSDPFYGAPTVLIVLADPERGTYVEDGSLVMGNLMLAAHAVGVDPSCKRRVREPGGKGPLKRVGTFRKLCWHRTLHPRLSRLRVPGGKRKKSRLYCKSIIICENGSGSGCALKTPARSPYF